MKPVRYGGAVIALVVLAGSVVLTLSRLLDSESEPWVLAASFVPWAAVGYLLALVLLVLLGWRWSRGRARTVLLVTAGVSVVGFGLHVWWLVPSYVGPHPTGKPDLVVVELNMLNGQANPGQTAALVRREHPDLLVLTEVTPEALDAVRSEGVVGPGSALPHLAGHALPGASGVVVASRSPLSQERTLATTHPGYLVRVRAPQPFEVLAVHAAQPAMDIDAWRRDHAAFIRQARLLHGPHLVVGDFNATLDHAPMRALLGEGLGDAAQTADSGWQPTWPSPGRVHVLGVPAPVGLFAIDHVLMSTHFSAVSTSATVVADTDHRALVARLARR